MVLGFQGFSILVFCGFKGFRVFRVSTFLCICV